MYRYFAWFGISGKVVLTALLSALAVGMCVADPCPPRMLCAAAMAVSSLGDIAMMEETTLTGRGKTSLFALGAALFMVAHVLYSLAYWKQLQAHGIIRPNGGTYLGMALLLVGCVSVLAFMVLAKKINGTALLGSLAYLAVISLNCTVIFTYAAGAGGIRLLCGVGALSFFISDYLIGAKVLGNIRVFQGDAAKEAVWWFYPVGQALMIVFLK